MSRGILPPPPVVEVEDDEALVRQLVEAEDVDAVIEQMEWGHYTHLAPILHSMAQFDRPNYTPRQRWQPQQQEKQEKHQGKYNSILRSPVDGMVEERRPSRQERIRTAWSPPPPPPPPPPPLEEIRLEPTEKKGGFIDAGVVSPPLTSPRASDKDTSSAPHENDHTEKPSLNRQRRTRPSRTGKLQPPIDSPKLMNSSPVSRRDYNAGQQRRRYHDKRRAPSFGEQQPQHQQQQQQQQPHMYVNRQLELSRSYRDLSSIRAPSSDVRLRRSQSADRDFYHRSNPYSNNNSNAANGYWRTLTPPPPETLNHRRRSYSPPVPPPSLSPFQPQQQQQQPQHHQYFQHQLQNKYDDMKEYYDDLFVPRERERNNYNQGDYWGRMDDGYDSTLTATTEEAHTPDDGESELEEEEEEYEEVGGYIAVPPRIIEREQHRRQRVVEPIPSSSKMLEESPKTGKSSGRRDQEGESKLAGAGAAAARNNNNNNNNNDNNYDCHSVRSEEDNSPDPSYNTHTVLPRTSQHTTNKGTRNSNNVRSNSDMEYPRTGVSLSSLAPTPQDYPLPEKKDQMDETRSHSQSLSRSQGVSERRPSTIYSAKDDTTLRPDATSGRLSGQRLSPALSPKRTRTSTPPAKLQDKDERRRSKQIDVKNRNTGRGVSPSDRQGGKGNQNMQKVGPGNNPKRNKRTVSPSMDEVSESSYSYSYSSYTTLSDASLSVSIPNPNPRRATKSPTKAAKVMEQRRNAPVRPFIGPKTVPPLGQSVRTPPNSIISKKMKQPVGTSSLSKHPLQRRQRQGPPPPGSIKGPPHPLSNYPSLPMPEIRPPPDDGIPSNVSHVMTPAQSLPHSLPKPFNMHSTASMPADQSLLSVPRSGSTSVFFKPYVSYMPSSLLAPTPVQFTQSGTRVSTSIPASTAKGEGEVQELLWRTSGSGSVKGKNNKVPSPSKREPEVKRIPVPQRSASAGGGHPQPPKNLPLRVRRSMSQTRSSSLSHTVEVPAQRPNGILNFSSTCRPSISAATPMQKSPDPHKLQQTQLNKSQMGPPPTFVIQLPNSGK